MSCFVLVAVGPCLAVAGFHFGRSGAVRALDVGGLAGLGGSKKKAEEEQMYYACMAAIFDEVIC